MGGARCGCAAHGSRWTRAQPLTHRRRHAAADRRDRLRRDGAARARPRADRVRRRRARRAPTTTAPRRRAIDELLADARGAGRAAAPRSRAGAGGRPRVARPGPVAARRRPARRDDHGRRALRRVDQLHAGARRGAPRSTSRARARSSSSRRGPTRAARWSASCTCRRRTSRATATASSASTTATSARAFATRTSRRSSRPSRSSPTAGCPPRSCARASSSATAQTGWTQAFNVIYWPLQAFARGLFPTVPGDPGASLDIVPVDTVANALLELLRGPVRGGAFHIVAGDEAPSNAELATMAAEAFDAEPPVFVGPGRGRGRREAGRRAGAVLQRALHVRRAARARAARRDAAAAARVLPVADALRPRGALGQGPGAAVGRGMAQRAA